MNSLLSSKPQTAYAARGTERAGRSEQVKAVEPVESGVEDTRRIPAAATAAATTAASTRPGPFASFVRFVVCGGGIGILSSFAVAGLADLMPWALANAVITIASTLLCTELHARFTFGSGKRPGWRQHWQSAGSAAAAYIATSAAMLLLHTVQTSPGALTEQIVYLSASALAGIGRFLVLRLYVFTTGRNRTAGRVSPESVVWVNLRARAMTASTVVQRATATPLNVVSGV